MAGTTRRRRRRLIAAHDFVDSAVVRADRGTVAETEWAVQERDTFDGPWARIDTGAGWSHRSGRGYTEEEARSEAAKRVNGIDPERWRRVVSREVTAWVPYGVSATNVSVT